MDFRVQIPSYNEDLGAENLVEMQMGLNRLWVIHVLHLFGHGSDAKNL